MSDPILVIQSFKANGKLYKVGTPVGHLQEGVIVPGDAGLTRGQIEARLPAKVLGLKSNTPPPGDTPETPSPADIQAAPYDQMSRAQLVDEVLARVNAGRDLNMSPKDKRADLVALLEQDDTTQGDTSESGE